MLVFYYNEVMVILFYYKKDVSVKKKDFKNIVSFMSADVQNYFLCIHIFIRF